MAPNDTPGQAEKSSRFNADVVFGIFAIALAAVFIWFGRNLGSMSIDGAPGPSAFPTGIAVISIFFAICVIIKGLRHEKPLFKLWEIKRESVVALIATILLFVVFFAIWFLWHYVPATIFLTFTLSLVYRQKLVPSLIFAVIFGVMVYLVFSKLLMVSLKIS